VDPYYRNGRRIEESTGYKKYDDARDVLKTREGAVAAGVPLTAQSTKLTFDDAAKDVETDYSVNKKRSLPELTRRLKLHLTPFFGGRRLSAITTADVRTFTAQRLEAKAAAGEINRELAILSVAMQLTGHKTEAVYRRYAITSEADLREGVDRLNA